MAGFITAQELMDASVDADTLERFVNEGNGVPNINRAGNDVGTLETLVAQALALAAAAADMRTFMTKAQMDAVTTLPANTYAQVTNDPTPANNGYYVFSGSAWVFSGLQPTTFTTVDAYLTRYRGTLPAGALNQRHETGIYLVAAGTAYTFLPEGFDTAQSAVLTSVKWSTDALNRYQYKILSMFAEPSVAWVMRYDNNSPSANPWRRVALNRYRGITPQTDANNITEPGRWLYTSALTNLPAGAPSSGFVDVEQAGTYRYQNLLSLSDAGYRQTRIIRVSPVEQGDWLYTGSAYRGVLTSGNVADYLTYGDYLFTAKLTGMPADGPVSGYFLVRRNGDYVTREVQSLQAPYAAWRQAYRVSTGITYDWGKLGGSQGGGLSGNYAIFGDSMTEFGTYVEDLQSRTGITALKFGFGGCNLAKHNRSDATDPYYDKLCMYNIARYIATGDFSEAVAAADWLAANTTSDFRATVAAMIATNWATVKYATIFFGTNDYGAGTALGDPEDVLEDGSTFYGAINYIVQTIQAAYPNISIAFISPPFRWRGAGIGGLDNSDINPNGTSGLFLREYVQALADRCAQHKLPFLDLLHESGINALNHAHTLPDGLHPSTGTFGGQTRVNGRIYGFFNDMG